MSKGKFALGALFGAAAGLVTGILTAPKSGKETREDIKTKAKEVKVDVTKKVESAASEANEIAEDVKSKAQDFAEDAKTSASDLKDRTERAVEGAKKGFFSNK